jgi:hypothetical protein
MRSPAVTHADANNDEHTTSAAPEPSQNGDDYITTPEEEASLDLPYNESADQIAAEGELRVTIPEVLAVRHELSRLDWRDGLHRDDIKERWRAFPVGIYLRLPASKTFFTPDEVLLACGLAPERAEGMYLGPHPTEEFPEAESIDEGGPPGWGDQPAVYPRNAKVEGGSAEDTEGPLSDQTAQSSEPESGG